MPTTTRRNWDRLIRSALLIASPAIVVTAVIVAVSVIRG